MKRTTTFGVGPAAAGLAAGDAVRVGVEDVPLMIADRRERD